jgi:peptidase E
MALPPDLDNLLLIEYFLKQTRRRRPRVCYIGAASGDAEAGCLRFYAGFSRFQCQPTHLPLFARTPRKLESVVMSQDAIFVGGGNTRSADHMLGSLP